VPKLTSTPLSQVRPLYPQKRTLHCTAANAALCQKRTYALQQNTPIQTTRRRGRTVAVGR
jgi:hypothetical protein